jgi:sec-independent protein translocase protein TatC
MSAEATEPDPSPEGEVKMTIWEHLDELRKRIIYATVGTLMTTIVAWTFHVEILRWLLKPYERIWAAHQLGSSELQTLEPHGAFIGYLRLSLVAGIVGAAPIIFYQLWAFISPGLYWKEKRLIVPFVFFSTMLFLSGVMFAYYVAFPFSFNYFLSLLGPVGAEGTVLVQRVTLEAYLDFVTGMLLAFGGVFELPLFISFLAIAGIVTPMQLLKFGRWAVLCSFIVGAVVTPGPEVTSQLAVSGALVALYFVSIGVAFIVGKRKPETKEEPKDTGAG